MRVLDSEGNELAWNKRSIKYNKRGDDYGFVRIPLTKDIEVGKEYTLVLDRDIADTAGIHLPAERIIHFTAVDAGADKPGMSVVEEFDKDDYCLGWGCGDGVLPLPTLNDSYTTGLFDKAMNLDYDYGNWNQIFLSYGPDWDLEKESWEQPFHRGDKVGIHLWGDMPCSKVFLRFRSYESGWVSLPLCTMDFHGWRYVELDLNELNPDEDYFLKDIAFYRNDSKMGKTGTLKLDQLIRGESSGIDELKLANMQVRVAGDYIVVSADTYIQGVELIDMQGRVMCAHGGNCLNVAGIPTGVYLVRVHINGMTSTQKVKL